MGIQGRSCIVTGASSGIGAATARQLNGLGANVTLAARHTELPQAFAPRRRDVELRSSRRATQESTGAHDAPEATTADVTITWAELAAGVHA